MNGAFLGVLADGGSRLFRQVRRRTVHEGRWGCASRPARCRDRGGGRRRPHGPRCGVPDRRRLGCRPGARRRRRHRRRRGRTDGDGPHEAAHAGRRSGRHRPRCRRALRPSECASERRFGSPGG
ncbi:hypothetical protein BRC97_07025 [Halobacteriales archaeon QS_6_71_20]|nr:MAG: hypothetical protein BRC97_07025 [Halobacteriales archaeon QS_6_71_20]